MLNSLVFTSDYRIFAAPMINIKWEEEYMDKTKLTREEAIRRYTEEDILKQPLSKMMQDIAKQLGVIK